MADAILPDKSQYIYRVDTFTVPNAARNEFIERVKQTHNILKTVPGFVQDFLLEQVLDDDAFKFVTIVEWDSTDAIEHAKHAIHNLHQEMGFNPQELFERYNIQVNKANYVPSN